MKKLLMLGLVLFAGLTLACSQKKGYLANGLFKKPSYLTENCGSLYTAFRNNIPASKNMKYVEVYIVSPGKYTEAGLYLQKSIESKGYFQVQSQKVGDTGYVFGYSNVSKVITLSVTRLGDTVVAIVGGNN